MTRSGRARRRAAIGLVWQFCSYRGANLLAQSYADDAEVLVRRDSVIEEGDGTERRSRLLSVIAPPDSHSSEQPIGTDPHTYELGIFERRSCSLKD